MAVVAVNLKIESGDDYLYLFKDVKSPSDFVNKVEAELVDELAYVYDFAIESDDDTCKFNEALAKRIDEVA